MCKGVGPKHTNLRHLICINGLHRRLRSRMYRNAKKKTKESTHSIDTSFVVICCHSVFCVYYHQYLLKKVRNVLKVVSTHFGKRMADTHNDPKFVRE